MCIKQYAKIITDKRLFFKCTKAKRHTSPYLMYRTEAFMYNLLVYFATLCQFQAEYIYCLNEAIDNELNELDEISRDYDLIETELLKLLK